MNQRENINIRFLFTFLFASVVGASLMAQTITATHLALSKPSFIVGDTINFAVDLKSNVASARYSIQHQILNSAGSVLTTSALQNDVAISNTANTRVNYSYIVSAGTANGAYRHQLIVKNSNWVWMTVTPNTLTYNVGATSTPATFNVTNLGPNKGIRGMYNRTEIISYNDQISSNQSVPSNYKVILRIQDAFGLVISEQVVPSVSLSSTPKVVSFSYTLPASMKIGLHTVRYLIKSTDGLTSYPITESNTRQSAFSVESYQPIVENLHPPASLVMLRPRVANENPLSGSGFLPNTADSYTMVFNDEFSSAQLDTSKWWTRYVYNGGTLGKLNDECQSFNERNTHPIVNGVMKLTARPKAGTTCHDSRYTQWDSGMLRSKTILKYGYFEIRVKLPKGVGIWPAFWLNPEDQSWPPEIDIMEYVINGQTEHPDMFHTGVVQRSAGLPQDKVRLYYDPNFNNVYTFFKAPAPLKDSYLNDDFHVISGFWNDNDTYATYIDGTPLVQYQYRWLHENGTSAGFAHILLNLAMGGSWGTSNWSSTMTTLPQEFEIDYIRVYQKSNKINKGTSTTGVNLCPATGC